MALPILCHTPHPRALSQCHRYTTHDTIKPSQTQAPSKLATKSSHTVRFQPSQGQGFHPIQSLHDFVVVTTGHLSVNYRYCTTDEDHSHGRVSCKRRRIRTHTSTTHNANEATALDTMARLRLVVSGGIWEAYEPSILMSLACCHFFVHVFRPGRCASYTEQNLAN